MTPRNPGWRHTWEGKRLHFFKPHPIYSKYEYSSCGIILKADELWFELDELPLCKKCELPEYGRGRSKAWFRGKRLPL